MLDVAFDQSHELDYLSLSIAIIMIAMDFQVHIVLRYFKANATIFSFSRTTETSTFDWISDRYDVDRLYQSWVADQIPIIYKNCPGVSMQSISNILDNLYSFQTAGIHLVNPDTINSTKMGVIYRFNHISGLQGYFVSNAVLFLSFRTH